MGEICPDKCLSSPFTGRLSQGQQVGLLRGKTGLPRSPALPEDYSSRCFQPLLVVKDFQIALWFWRVQKL